MSRSRVLQASAVACVMAMSLGAVTLSGQSPNTKKTVAPAVSVAQNTQAAPAKAPFAALARIKAEPMTSTELDAVKGLHVHFVVPSSQNAQYGPTGLHIAGNPFEHNWENLGGTDPAPVAPSYNGLCKAVGPSPLFIPFNPAMGTQCP